MPKQDDSKKEQVIKLRCPNPTCNAKIAFSKKVIANAKKAQGPPQGWCRMCRKKYCYCPKCMNLFLLGKGCPKCSANKGRRKTKRTRRLHVR